MKDIQQETGTAYLFIAHDLSMVKYISDRIGVLHLGHLLETGTTEEIFEHPIHPYTRSLLSAIPLPTLLWKSAAWPRPTITPPPASITAWVPATMLRAATTSSAQTQSLPSGAGRPYPPSKCKAPPLTGVSGRRGRCFL